MVHCRVDGQKSGVRLPVARMGVSMNKESFEWLILTMCFLTLCILIGVARDALRGYMTKKSFRDAENSLKKERVGKW